MCVFPYGVDPDEQYTLSGKDAFVIGLPPPMLCAEGRDFVVVLGGEHRVFIGAPAFNR